MSNILNGQDEPQDDGWADFLSQPMSALIGQTDTQIAANAPTGFRDRYDLAMRFVYLLSVAFIVGLGVFALSALSSEETEFADGGRAGTEIDDEVAPAVASDDSTSQAETPGSGPALVPDTSRFEFVVQTDDPEGPFWYVLDKEENTRLWAAECLAELGEPEREIVWAELSTFAEPEVFTECNELVALIDSRPLVEVNASSEEQASSQSQTTEQESSQSQTTEEVDTDQVVATEEVDTEQVVATEEEVVEGAGATEEPVVEEAVATTEPPVVDPVAAPVAPATDATVDPVDDVIDDVTDPVSEEVEEVPAPEEPTVAETVATTEPPAPEPGLVPDTSRFEFVVQTDDPEGPFWYVLDKQENRRLWAAECLAELGEPERDTVWAELSTFVEAEFTECSEIVGLIDGRQLVEATPPEAVDSDRYEFVVQTDDPEGLFWYVLDNQENTRLWAAECLTALGEPEREILWPELSTYDEPEAFTECNELVPLVQNR